MKFFILCLRILRAVVLGLLIVAGINYLIYLMTWGNVHAQEKSLEQSAPGEHAGEPREKD